MPGSDPTSVNKLGWMRRMLPYLRPHRRNAVIALGASIAGMVASALTPVVEKVIVDDVALHHRRPLVPWLALLIGAGIFGFGAAHIRRFVGGRVSIEVPNDLRNAIFERLHRLDFARHDEMQTGQIVSRAISDLDVVQGLLAFLPLVIGNVVMLFVSLAVMLVLSPLLTLVALGALPVLATLSRRLRTSLYPASWDAQQRAANVAGVVEEAVTGVRVVKGFGQEDRELARLSEAARRLFASQLRTIRMKARLQSVLESVPGLTQVATLALGGWLAIHGRLTLGTFLAFSSYMVALGAPVRMMAGLMSYTQQARAGAERILEVLESNPTIVEADDAVALASVEGEVIFDDVTFGYVRSRPVLDGFSLHLRPGERVALVGASGSGKSTVALLLPRFYEVQGGTVRVDGHDVASLTLDSLRRNVGVVFEESFMFSDTVRANIAFGQPDASDAAVEASARAAEAHDFISAMPLGYHTVIGERGLTLSGGQRQRLALARALLADPRILILDDATSSVDAATESEIHATLRRLMADRTTIVIAHRRSSLLLADRVVLVDSGRVVDSGTQAELMSRSALFRRLLANPGEVLDADDGEQATVDEGDASVAAGAVTTAPPVMNVGVGGLGRSLRGGPRAAAILTPSPEMMAAVELLAPATDDPAVEIDTESDGAHRFTLRRLVRPFRRQLIVGFAMIVAQTVLNTAGPALVRRGIDRGVTRHATAGLWAAVMALLAVVIVEWGIDWVQTIYTGRTSERLLYVLRVKVFAQLQKLGLDYYDREPAGRIMTRMTADVDAFSTLLETGLISAVGNILSFVAIAVALLLMDVRLAFAAFSVFPFLGLATWWFRRRSARAYYQARDRVAAVNANLQESLAGVRATQAHRGEQRAMTEFRAVTGRYRDARLSAQRLVATYFPFVGLLSDIAAAVVLGVGAPLVASGHLTAGALIAFLLYLNLLFAPVQELSHVFDNWQQAAASLNQVADLMATPTSTPSALHPVFPTHIEGAVRLEDVHLLYSQSTTEALAGISLDVAAGEAVAVVGETGAGKSSLIKVIARFYDPTAGQVLIDGVPLANIDLGCYRRHLGYVPQEPFLFAGTVRSNIAYGRPDATSEEVESAARAVGADDFVEGLDGGYEHVISERGRSLSAGQRQLVALARALLVDPAILLLDEATSNLDLATEAKVSDAMTLLASGRTSILIAHRLQTARRADRIVVMGGGRIVEQGSHDQLLATGGLYANLWETFEVDRPQAQRVSGP